MKTLLALVLSLGAMAAFAGNVEPRATEKLTSFLPVGHYAGVTDSGNACKVFVEEANYPNKDIQVRIIDGDNDLTKLVEENSEFGYKDYKREFVQTERNLIGTEIYNYVERIVRTVSAGDRKQYVVISYSVVINRSRDTQTAECLVDL